MRFALLMVSTIHTYCLKSDEAFLSYYLFVLSVLSDLLVLINYSCMFFTNWSTSVSIFTTPFASTASNTSFIVKAFISIRVACVLTFGHVRASYNSLNTFLHLLWVSIKILNYTFGYICRNRTRSLCHLVVLPSAGIVGAVKVADAKILCGKLYHICQNPCV